MAEGVDIMEEIFADNDSDGEENFEGFDLNEADIDNDQDSRNYDVLDDHVWVEGDRVPPRLDFTGQPGIQHHITDLDSPLEYFNLFINDNDCDEIAQETNRYAAQVIGSKHIKQHSRCQRWKETTGAEIKRFLAIIIAMCLVVQLDVSEYWATNTVTSTPFFLSVMSRDRFLLLLTFFHLNDNVYYIARGLEGHNPLFKLGQFYERMLVRFRGAYLPNQNLSIDERMVAWRGNLSFRVYSPDKPVKYGLKSYMLCDAENAYCLKFQLYTGKQSVQPSENGATYDLVMNLMRNYFEKGHILYCDNYYSSPRLFMDLWYLRTGATVTERAYRKGIPTNIKQVTLKNKGDTSTMHYGPLSVLKYQDTKTVYLLSTVDTSENVQTGRHGHRDNRGEKVRPSMVHHYDLKMGTVDRNNQMVDGYKLNIKTLKWWKKLIFHMVNLAIVNAYVLYKENKSNGSPLNQRLFRRKLVEQLLQHTGLEQRVTVGHPTTMVLERLTGRHFISKIDEHKAVTRQCIVCGPGERSLIPPPRAGEKRPKHYGHLTTYQCTNCNVPLCVIPCFELFHTKQEYILAYKRLKSTHHAHGILEE